MSNSGSVTNQVTVTIDGKTVVVPQGMNLVEAAKQAGVDIPVFCYHSKLKPAGVCRMCLVQVEKMPKPVTACTTPCTDGMVVHTKTDTVEQLRKGVLEFTLLNHPLDCPVCDKGGECDLQDMTFDYGATSSRLHDGKLHKKKAAELGPFIVLDEERCILCRRCVRFDDQIAQERNLVIKERGVHNVVATTAGQPYDSYFSGNTIELCPVGALTSETYRFKARPWDLAKAPGVCTGCSVGCHVEQHYRFGRLLRLVGQENAAVNDGWLCDRGRFNHQFVGSDAMLKSPLVKRNGEFVQVTWAEALQEVAAGFRKAIEAKGSSSVGVIGGGRLTTDEAYQLQKFARLALGTGNVDHRVAGQILSSHAGFPGTMADIDDATLVLVVDSLPAEQAPVLDLRIRKATEAGQAKVVSVGSTLPQYRSRSRCIGAVPSEVANVLADADLAARVVVERKVVAIWDGRNVSVGKALINLLTAVQAQGNAAHLLIIGEQTNSRGAEWAGMLPGLLPGLASVTDAAARIRIAAAWGGQVPPAGLDTVGMLKAAASGEIAALLLVGANLVNTFPDGKLVRDALSRLPFLVVQDLFLTETARLAHVVLPAASFAAKSGTYHSLDGRAAKNNAAMPTEHDTRTDAEIIAGLAAEFGLEISSDPETTRAEVQQVTGIDYTTLVPGLSLEQAAMLLEQANVRPHHTQASQGGLTVVAVDRLYAGGGTALFDAAIERVRPEAAAYLHPMDAAGLQLTEGAAVLLTSGDVTLELVARLRSDVVPGTVQVVKGLPQAPANQLGTAATLRLAQLQKAEGAV